MDAVLRPGGRRRDRLPVVLLLVLLGLAAALPVGRTADPAAPVFGALSAEAELGSPAVFRTSLPPGTDVARVDLLLRLPREEVVRAREAEVLPDGTVRAVVPGHHLPNTTWLYRFRVRLDDGARIESPEASVTVADPRFAWRTLLRDGIELRWYDGDDAFAERALRVGADAVDAAAELLGARPPAPVTLLVYASTDDLYGALGPGTRENVGGQANAETGTMYALISPGQRASDWEEIVIGHELTHLVFDAASANPWREPPRWLNEGIAVWLTEGYGASDRSQVERAAAAGSLIPLEGLAGYFPSTPGRFSLAYAESASAIDHLARRWGREAVGRLARAYRDGVTDDAAFRAAIGIDLAAFEATWLAGLGVERPDPLGPVPAPPGPVPPGWTTTP